MKNFALQKKSLELRNSSLPLPVLAAVSPRPDWHQCLLCQIQLKLQGAALTMGRSVSAEKPRWGHTALPPVTALKASLGFQKETCLPLSSHWSSPEIRQVSPRMRPQQRLQGRGLGGLDFVSVLPQISERTRKTSHHSDRLLYPLIHPPF